MSEEKELVQFLVDGWRDRCVSLENRIIVLTDSCRELKAERDEMLVIVSIAREWANTASPSKLHELRAALEALDE